MRDAGKNREIAASFLEKANGSSDVTERLLCVYDGFVALFGPMKACLEAARVSGVDMTLLEGMLDYCMDDGDGDGPEGRVRPDSDSVDRLVVALRSCLGL